MQEIFWLFNLQESYKDCIILQDSWKKYFLNEICKILSRSAFWSTRETMIKKSREI